MTFNLCYLFSDKVGFLRLFFWKNNSDGILFHYFICKKLKNEAKKWEVIENGSFDCRFSLDSETLNR